MENINNLEARKKTKKVIARTIIYAKTLLAIKDNPLNQTAQIIK